MENKFKFRAWDKKTQTMHYGFNSKCEAYVIATDLELRIGTWEDEKTWRDFKIMQCTGLKDKNSKLIYENDILEIESMDLKNEKDKKYRYVAPAITSWHFWEETQDAIEEGRSVEILGNKFENPELIKKPINDYS